MKGLDWSNESYVRLHRSDTPAWRRLRWEAQTVYMALLRKLDRAGCMPLDGLLPFEAVAEMIACPEEVAERALQKLLLAGFLEVNQAEDVLVDPYYLEREEATMSDKQRKRESRARRRDRAIALQTVTDESQNVTKTSRDVTSGHERSRAVTSGHSFPSVPDLPDLPEKEPPIPPEGGSVRRWPDWATKAARGNGATPGEVCEAICRCIEQVHLKPPNPARAATAAGPILALWKKLERPPIAQFEDKYRLVARAGHECPHATFERGVRGNFDGGQDRSRSTATMSRQDRWDERLQVAQDWQDGKPMDSPSGGKPKMGKYQERLFGRKSKQ